MKQIFSVFFLVLFTIELSAQEKSHVYSINCLKSFNEKIFIHLNKSTYVSGEKLYYKVYVTGFNELPGNYTSTIVYFEITDKNNKTVHSWRTNTLNNVAFGNITLPDTISSNGYVLKAYTNYSRNFPSGYIFQTPLCIVKIGDSDIGNIFIHKQTTGLTDFDVLGRNFVEKSKSNFELNLSNSVFSVGESITIDITFDNLNESDSISFSISANELSVFDAVVPQKNIRQWFFFEPEFNVKLDFYDSENDSNISKRKSISEDGYFFGENTSLKPINIYSKEIGRFLLKGRLQSRQDKKVLADKLILASYQANTSNFEFVFTDKNGEFEFRFDTLYDNRTIILQVADFLNDIYNVEWVIYSKGLNETASTQSANITINNSQSDYINRIQKAEIIKRIYNPETINTAKTSGERNTSFYLKPNYVIYPDDYEELSNFSEIAINLLQGVRFKKEQNGYNLSMVMVESQVVKDDDILIFLNGVPFFNLDYIAGLGSKDIERIEVRNSEFMYGDLYFNGILAIYTNNKTFDPGIFKTAVLFYQNTVNANNIKLVSNSPDKNIPNLAPDFYWNPSVVLTGNKNKDSVNFQCPDYKSDFKITVNGMGNNGKTYYNSVNFKVQ